MGGEDKAHKGLLKMKFQSFMKNKAHKPFNKPTRDCGRWILKSCESKIRGNNENDKVKETNS